MIDIPMKSSGAVNHQTVMMIYEKKIQKALSSSDVESINSVQSKKAKTTASTLNTMASGSLMLLEMEWQKILQDFAHSMVFRLSDEFYITRRKKYVII